MADKNNAVVTEVVAEEQAGFMEKTKGVMAAAGQKVKNAATSKVGCFVGGVATGVLGTLGVQKVAAMNADSKALKALQATTEPRGIRKEDF